MSEKRRSWFNREVKIGLAVVAALAMLYFGINFLKGVNLFKPATYFYVQYDRVDGIVQTTHVMINGYKVGQVDDILFDYTKEAPVTLVLSVDKRLRVPKGTVVEVYETGLLGDKALQLKLGRGEELCQRGDTLPGIQSPGLIGQIMGAVSPVLEKLAPSVDSALVAVRDLASNEDLKRTLGNARVITDNLKNTSVKLDRMVDDAAPLMADARYAVNRISAFSGQLDSLDLAATMRSVDETVANLNLLTGKFRTTDNTLGLLVNDRGLYDNLNATVGSANDLLLDLRAHPKRYVHFSVFGAKDKGADEGKRD